MNDESRPNWIIRYSEPILVTGANGFIGVRVVNSLLEKRFTNLRCLVRPSGSMTRLNEVLARHDVSSVSIMHGNLLSEQDCQKAAAGVTVVYHLAAGTEKAFAGAFMNSVVTTRNLLDKLITAGSLRRFVNTSSLGVYSNEALPMGAVLDETCPVEHPPYRRGEAYIYGKIKQDDLVRSYGQRRGIPYVIVRPGAVYGPGKRSITGRVGIDTFGIFLHLGRSITLPLTYVDNCADAIVLAGLVPGVESEVFNIVDDDLPSSREFLRLYKKNVRRFSSIYIPYWLAYLLCFAWERYSQLSADQIPPVFNRSRCSMEWKGNAYPNEKLKHRLGWKPRVPFELAIMKYFEYQREGIRAHD